MAQREPEDVVERALVRIRRDQQARRLHHTAADPVAASSVDAARFRYLDALEEAADGMAISAIGQAIGVDRPRASRLTTELLHDGLIERRPDPDDSRYALVRLTAQGRALVDDIHRTRRVAVAEALAAFTPEESRLFADLLDRFVTAWPRPD
ncbi:MarR family winged helix-turn-helix transcriptional regulator [Actinocorallia sp. A-T 12471]|uniref:MarR family winged helix-turn-helix transcriptional regulator n=1 Tax=Actinocorallia sp. A-T 12471 TaxID=3089813 RepID=UPI0029CD04E1|nr:MarR family transcriptional regulator [Actinocorallia sp. A-T 12471]MDX6740725.1 MarR family transcriptional regulator [Actinocorallia sp. A-T 12471]